MRLADWLKKNGFKPREIPKFPTNRSEKEKVMAEEEKKVETPVEQPKVDESVPYYLIGMKVRVWTHHQQSQCIEGKMVGMTKQYMRVRAMEGKDFYVWFTAGPIVQALEF